MWLVLDSLQPHVCLFYLSSLLISEMETHWTMWILNIDWKKIQLFLCWWEFLSSTSIENCLLRDLPHSSEEYLKLSLSHFSKSLLLYGFFSQYLIIHYFPFLSITVCWFFNVSIYCPAVNLFYKWKLRLNILYLLKSKSCNSKLYWVTLIST